MQRVHQDFWIYHQCAMNENTQKYGMFIKTFGYTISHDSITRFLSTNHFGNKSLWTSVKPLVRERENDNACLVFISLSLKNNTLMKTRLRGFWSASKIVGQNILTYLFKNYWVQLGTLK